MIPTASLPFSTPAPTPGGHHRVRREDFRKFLLAMNLPIDETLFKEAPR
jgi:hypothetical protein